MNTYFKNLMDGLNKKIQPEQNSFSLTLDQVKQNKMLSLQSLEKLEGFSKTYRFKSEDEEIHYYKNLKPQLVAQIIYYCQAAMIISRIPLGSIEAKQDHFKNELKKIEAFFQTNVHYISQYRAKETINDKHFYLTKNLNINLLPAHMLVNTNDNNQTNGSFFMAELLANEKLQKFLLFQLDNLEITKNIAENSKTPNLGFSWTAPKVALIELIYALFSQGAINKGDVEIIHLVKNFEQFFNIELGDPYRMFTEIKQRKKSPTIFLKTLVDKLNQYIIEQENLDKEF